MEARLLGSRGSTPSGTPKHAKQWMFGAWAPPLLLVAVVLTLGLLSMRAEPVGAGVRLKELVLEKVQAELPPELAQRGARAQQPAPAPAEVPTAAAAAGGRASQQDAPACKPCPACPAAPAGGMPGGRGGRHAAQQRGQGQAAAQQQGQAAAKQQPVDWDDWMERLTVPWGPQLTQEEVQRGLTYWGSGKRMRQLAQKLVAGKPIKVFTLGASVTRGIGTTDRRFSYARRFFEFIATAFPNKDHVFTNRGIGGTSSAIYSVCAEHMVDEDADLLILEFSANDKRDAPYSDPERQGYEQLIRKLLALKSSPALIQLHHYAWWHAVGDGIEDGGLFYHPAGEAQLGVFAHYYDFPSVSVRAALWHLMRARVNEFNPDKARAGATASPTDYPIPGAEPGREKSYWYRDRTHPGDEGHAMLAELLSHTLAKAVLEELLPPPLLHRPRRFASLAAAQDERGLPLPMIPGNAVAPTTLCAIEADFEEVVVASSGFEYKPERPAAKNFLEQKWGWTSNKPGSWAEVEFDSETGLNLTGNATEDRGAQVSLSYLKSYRGMGTADVACVRGCTCEPQRLDGTWETEVSLQQILQFWVSRHKRCRVRITVSPEPGRVPQKGHKVQLLALMVSQFAVRLTTYADQVRVLHQAVV